MKKLYGKTAAARKSKKDDFREFVNKSLSPITSPQKLDNPSVRDGGIMDYEGNLNYTNTINNTFNMSKAPHNKTNFYKFSMQQVE